MTTEDKEDESVVFRSANVLRIFAVFEAVVENELCNLCERDILRIRIQK